MQDSENKTADVVTLSLPAAYSQGGFVQVRTVVVPVRECSEAGPLPRADGSTDAMGPPPGQST
jgi:hypothetical protein